MRRSQQDRSTGTKAALTAAARELFATRGYHAVPADEIVRAAGVTRGALYHHYDDKQGLFRAVVHELEAELTAEIRAVSTDAPGAMLAAFLDACARPEVRQVCLLDAPAVLGWREWRAIEAEHGLGLLIEVFGGLIEQGVLPEQPVEVLARLVLSALIETALLVADAEDPVRVRGEAEAALMAWFGGLLGV